MFVVALPMPALAVRLTVPVVVMFAVVSFAVASNMLPPVLVS